MKNYQSTAFSVYDLKTRIYAPSLRPLFARNAHAPLQFEVERMRKRSSIEIDGIILRSASNKRLGNVGASLRVVPAIEKAVFTICLFVLELENIANMKVSIQRIVATTGYPAPTVHFGEPTAVYLCARENVLGGQLLGHYDLEIENNQLALFHPPKSVSLNAFEPFDRSTEGYVDIMTFSNL